MSRRQLLIRLAAFSFGHFLALALLNSFIYLLAHIPTAVVKLDKVIILLTYFQQVLTFPRWLLRQVWFGESTPTLLNWTLAIANTLIWGAALTYFTRNRWRNTWDNAV